MRGHRAALLGLVALAACGGERTPASPTPAPEPPRTTVVFAEPFSQIVLGDVAVHRVAADDPPCRGDPQWQCWYYRVAMPRTGMLKVTLTAQAGNLDVSVGDITGMVWWDPSPIRGLVQVSVPAKGGDTYQITVWEYERPGVEFELRTALQ